MQKYNNVPIISADDDCMYLYNYADELYSNWIKHKNAVFTYKRFVLQSHIFQHGPATIYPSGVISLDIGELSKVLDTNADDVYIGYKLEQANVQIKELSTKVPYIFHDCTEPLSEHEQTVQQSYAVIRDVLNSNHIQLENKTSFNLVECCQHTGTPIVCIFGCLLSEVGKQIKNTMLSWITSKYDCIAVNQDMPGELYEWPALAFAKTYSIRYDIPVLYLHTKGAFNSTNVYNQAKVRKLWEDEFINHYEWYATQVLSRKHDSIVAGPFIADPHDGHTWLNGFIATPSAWKQVDLTTPSHNRYIYEFLFRECEYIPISRIYGNINGANSEYHFDKLVDYVNSL